MKRILVLCAISFALAACTQPSNTNQNANKTEGSGDAAFKATHDKYVVEFLRRNPQVNTYLGGAGLDPSLKEVDGTLRDYSTAALEAEDRWLADSQKAFEAIDATSLSPSRRIDREVAIAQINFQLHQHQVRKYQERALDTYTVDPFRSISFYRQGMTGAETGSDIYGTPEEWALVIKRLQAVPRYLQTAQDQLQAGVKSGNTPDWRMLKRDGLDTATANAEYFEKKLPEEAAKNIAAGAQRDELLKQLNEASKAAATAYRGLHDFVAKTFFDDAGAKNAHDGVKAEFRNDHFAMGTGEYNWALQNNLRMDKTAAQLYEEAWPIVQATQQEMIKVAGEIAAKRNIKAANPEETAKAVLEELSKEYPKTDAEEVNWYKEAGVRLVDYARKTGLFDVPPDYKLDVVETPPPLRASIDGAAYYPAPPFKNSGVGRFYVTTSGNNDQAILKEANRAALADLAAHEGFPGHDWHYKVMTQNRENIAGVRWLTPGAVEDSSSMWEDSVAAEGWALYSEALMAEPQPGAPDGFYTPEEHLYQLQGKLYRDLRVRVDTGIHTGLMSYDEAVDLFSQVRDFLPGSCSIAGLSEAKRASCNSSERAIFRYSKWPTQAITYRLGKDQIFALRKEAAGLLGDKFSAKAFHVLFMKQGTIPSGYFHDELLRQLR
ncbi:MAG: hypothetical protein QOD75_4091 [Blastocatellia bacterium]|jgi:uncharacterized protein (DUF885 family)|nr:hypothetical protein [Blastocatellia bacterium]